MSEEPEVFLKTQEKPVIVIARPDRIGDALISSTCFAAVRKKYSDAQIYFLAREDVRPLFHQTKNLTGFLPMPNPEDDPQNRIYELNKMFLSLKTDAVISLNPDPAVYLAAFQANIPIRIGWKEELDFFSLASWRRFFLSESLTHSVSDTRYQGKKHEALYNFNLLKFIGATPPSALTMEIASVENAAETLLQKVPWLRDVPFCVVHATTARKVRRWPGEHFVELSRWLIEHYKCRIISVGKTEESQDPLFDLKGNPAYFSLDGKLDLAELALLLKYARLFISCDTGPGHLASAVDCPQVMIFGRTEPEYAPARWRALGENVEIIRPRTQKHFWETKRAFWKRSFESIEPRHVKTAIERRFPVEGG